MQSFIGVIRLLGVSIILLLIILILDLKYVSMMVAESGIGGIIGFVSILGIFFYHLSKGIYELRGTGKYKYPKLQNFSTVFSILILIIIIGNLMISEREFELTISSLIVVSAIIFIIVFAVIDVFKLTENKI